MKMNDIIAFSICHPFLEKSDGCALPPGQAHYPYPEIDDTPFASSKLRYIPQPTLLLLECIHRLYQQQPAQLQQTKPERIGLFVDTGCSFLDIQKEYYMPIHREGTTGASPLLFPHTSELSAASIAAIHFNIKGPAITLHGYETAEEASSYLNTGDIDLAIVAALNHWPESCAQTHMQAEFDKDDIPFVDCAATMLLGCPWRDVLPHVRQPRMYGSTSLQDKSKRLEKLGKTGCCEYLLNILF